MMEIGNSIWKAVEFQRGEFSTREICYMVDSTTLSPRAGCSGVGEAAELTAAVLPDITHQVRDSRSPSEAPVGSSPVTCRLMRQIQALLSSYVAPAPFPPEIADGMYAGASDLRAFRDHSGRTLEEVAHASGAGPARLCEIEAEVASTLAEGRRRWFLA